MPAVGDHENGRDQYGFAPSHSRPGESRLLCLIATPTQKLEYWLPKCSGPQALPSLAEPLLNAALMPVAAEPGQFELVTDRTAAVSAERPD